MKNMKIHNNPYEFEINLSNDPDKPTKIIMTGDATGIVNHLFQMFVNHGELVELVEVALDKYDLVSGTCPN